MNNWDTAVEATTTAYNSQGSAMQEQEAYMDSYEAKLNVMKTRMTELALAVGDAILSDGLFMLIDTFGKLVDIGVSFTKEFGVMPSLLLAIGGGLKVFGVMDKITATLKATKENMAGFWTTVGDEGTKATGELTKNGTAMEGTLSRVDTKAKNAGLSFGKIGGALKGLMGGLAISAGLMAIGWAIEKIVSHVQEAKREMEEWDKTVETAVETYNNHGNSIDGLIDEYDKLNKQFETNKDAMSDEELARYNELVNELQTILPSVVDHVDANGQAHLRTTDAIREESEWIERLATGQKEMIALEFAEAMDKNAESLSKVSEKMEKARDEVLKMKETMEKGTELTWDYSGDAPAPVMTEVDQDKAGDTQAQNKNKQLMLEYEYNNALNDTVKTMQTYSIQMLNADGKTANMSDSAKRAVEQLFSMNKTLLDVEASGYKGAEATAEFEKRSDSLTAVALEVGEELNKMYGNLESSLSEIEFAEAKVQLDALVSAMPEDAFTLSEDALNSDKALDYVAVMEDLVVSIQSGDENFDGMIETLVDLGMSQNDASKWVIEMGNALDNQAIKSAVAQEELEAFNEEVYDTALIAMEAFDPLQKLFGFQDPDMKGVQSYLEQIQILKGTTDDWQSESFGKEAIDKIANYFGVSKKYVRENADVMYEGMQAVSTMTVGNYDVLDETGEQMLNEAGEVIQEYGFIFAEGTSATAQEFAKSMYYAGLEGGAGFKNNFAREVGALSVITDEMVVNLQEKLAEFAKNPTKNEAGFLNFLKEDLNELEGSFTLVEDEFGKMKFAMATGEESPYFDALNQQFEDLGYTIGWTQDETTGLWEVVVQDPTGGNGAPIITKVTQQAKDLDMGVQYLKEKYGLMVDDFTEENKAVFLETIFNQAQLSGQEIGYLEDENGNLKLAFADGSSSYWLDTVNQLLADSETKVSEVEDANGNLKQSFNTSDGVGFLDEAVRLAEATTEELEKTRRKAEEAKSALSETSTLGEGKVAGAWLSQTNENASGTKLIDDTIKQIKRVSDEIDKANDKSLNPGISATFTGTLSNVVVEIETTSDKVQTLATDLSTVETDVARVQQSVDSLSGAGGSISTVAGMAKNLKDELNGAKDAFINMASASGVTNGMISSVGLRESVTEIEGLVGRMRLSVEGIKNVYADMIIATATIGQSLNLDAVREYQTGFSLNLLLINSNYGAHIQAIANETGKFRQLLLLSTSGLMEYANNTNVLLSVMSIMYSSFSSSVSKKIGDLSTAMTNRYGRAVSKMSELTTTMRNSVAFGIDKMATATDSSMRSMADNMVKVFREAVREIQEEARNIPSLVGGGIRANLSDATSSIRTLADTLVTNFKNALGIHSPSRVFEGLGGYVVDGLVNGLSNGNLLDLGSKVFGEFGNGAFTTLDSIKGYLNADWAVANGGVQDWIASAVAMTGVPASWIGPLSQIAMHESGGNPSAQNNWDINAQNGIPSKGLMQTIEPTFNANMMSGFGDILNPVHNAIASINYILKRYGNVFNVPGIKGLMNGTGYVGYGEGTDTNVESHGTESFASSIYSSGLADSFSSSAQFGGEAGSGMSSAVGRIAPAVINLADTYSTSADNKDDRYAETMEDLFVVDKKKREAEMLSAMIRRANTELNALTEGTLKYRNALNEVTRQENLHKANLQSQLKTQKAQHANITKQITALSDTKKHTIEQRKRYNELQQQFESSMGTIYTLENEIRSLEIAISDRTVQIFEDYLGEIVNKYAGAIEASNDKIDNIDFKLSVNEFSDLDSMFDNMVLERQKLSHLIGQETTVRNQIADLNTAHKNAQSRYGKNSKQAQLAFEAMLLAEEELEDSTLARMQQEQKLKDARQQTADDSVKILKDYYGTVKDITTSALEAERKELEKNHDLKMSLYDEEIDRINSIYDAKVESLDKDKEENQYLEEINTKNTARVDLMNQISKASRDNSLEGKKLVADLQSQLTTVNEEIATMQSERQDKLYREAIEAQRLEQIKAIETQKETTETEYNLRVEGIEKQVLQAQEAYDGMINDEAMWKKLTDQMMAGNANPMTSMIENMERQLSQMMSGDYSSIIPNFNELSVDLKQQLKNDNSLDLSNFAVEFGDTIEDIKSMTDYLNTYKNGVGGTGGANYNNPSITDGSGTKYNSSINTSAPNKPAPVPAKPKTETKPQRSYTIKDGDTLWDLAQQYYGNPFKWTTIAQANENPDPYKLQIGRKLIIPFKTGGFTGDWSGDEGKIAMLHKKELVLNAEQTSHILDSAKIMQAISGMMPKFKVNTNNSYSKEVATSGQTIHIANLNMEFENFRGTKEDSNNMVKDFMTKLRKV